MIKCIPPVLQASELLALYQTENIVLIEASNGKKARANYEARHLEGALFVDLDTQLAAITADGANEGRHPLPAIEDFAKTLSSLGISVNSHVIIYDDKNGANAAARFWWMLTSIGHKKTQVLNGGFQAAEKVGFAITATVSMPQFTDPYPIYNWLLPLATMPAVESVAGSNKHLIIDVRGTERYNGFHEPIDLVARHIPGAVNVPYTENLDTEGLFLPPATLKTKFETTFGDIANENIIVHCGSGVTACHTLLAVAYAGLTIPALYVGSWSEWSRNNKPIATTNSQE
jgi:thiosulfate/3-mercaptopyruvate sulfurtransferase